MFHGGACAFYLVQDFARQALQCTLCEVCAMFRLAATVRRSLMQHIPRQTTLWLASGDKCPLERA